MERFSIVFEWFSEIAALLEAMSGLSEHVDITGQFSYLTGTQ